MLRTNDPKLVCHRTWWVALTWLGSIYYLTRGWDLPCSLSALSMLTGKCLGRQASRSESDTPIRLGLLRLARAVPHPHPLDALSHSVSQCGWCIQKNFKYSELAWFTNVYSLMSEICIRDSWAYYRNKFLLCYWAYPSCLLFQTTDSI